MAEESNVPTMRLEVVPIGVSNIEQSINFYVEKVGFHLDHEVEPGNGMHIVQLTPPGSACSIVFGTGMGDISELPPGLIKGLHLVVRDVHQIREQLVSRGVEVSPIQDMGSGIKYAFFADPDGNSWALQELPPRM